MRKQIKTNKNIIKIVLNVNNIVKDCLYHRAFQLVVV
jgi:hypothetical protein